MIDMTLSFTWEAGRYPQRRPPLPLPGGGPSTVTLIPSNTQTTIGCSYRAIDTKQKLVLISLHLFSFRVCSHGDGIRGFTHSKPMSTCSAPRLYPQLLPMLFSYLTPYHRQ